MSAPSFSITNSLPVIPAQSAQRELRLQRVLIAYIVGGLFFMVLPGTFLGLWNLVSISSRRALESLSPAWLQAHGHAQIFGWIGTFILGIGFYSLSKMGRLPAFAVSRVWMALTLWVSGAALRWAAGVLEWHWRVLLPLSGLLELFGFLIFFQTVSGHRAGTEGAHQKREPWMILVMASTLGFLASLVLNASASIRIALEGIGPAFPHVFDQRLVALEAWCFLVPAIWGFNARWLPVFLGLRAPDGGLLLGALALNWAGVAAMFAGLSKLSALFPPVAAVVALSGLRVWRKSIRPAKIEGVHPSFQIFVRAAYAWLLVGSGLWLLAAWFDRSGGIWGAARHALTVGFISTMVFAIGQRVLPAFGGARRLYSPRLMLASLAALTVGCSLRVGSEIPAYEGYSRAAWHLLPYSAVIELIAVSLFAMNLLMTFLQPPAHLQEVAR
jgi:hypothetical protein